MWRRGAGIRLLRPTVVKMDVDRFAEGRNRAEFRAGWPALIGATAATSTGGAIYNYTATFFVKAIQQDFGWSRGEIATGATIMALTSAAVLPVVGHLTDRLGPLRVGALGLAAYGLMCFALASINANIPVYYGVLFVLALAFAASTAVTFAPLVARQFVQARGLALGIMMGGPAILLIPASPLLTNLIAQSGWRAGYVAMGLAALVIGLPGLWLASRSRGAGVIAMSQPPATGLTLPEILRRASYWKLVGGTALSTVPLGGFLHHYAPLLSDRGLSTAELGLLASIFVGMILLGRLGVGTLLDRVNPPMVAMIAIGGAAAGSLVILMLEPSFVTATMFLALIGWAFGSEGDIYAFFSAREFGLKSFSTVFGTLSMITAAGFGFGSLLFGTSFDWTGSYDFAVGLSIPLLLGAALLFGSLPRRPSFVVDASH